MRKKILVILVIIITVLATYQIINIYNEKTNTQQEVFNTKDGTNNEKLIDGIHPVIIFSGEIIGGSINGEWRSAGVFNNLLVGTEKYKLYDNKGVVREISDNIENRDKNINVGENIAIIYKLPEEILFNDDYVHFDFGISAEWNALPRITKAVDTDNQSFIEATKNIVKKNGYDNLEVFINKAIEAYIEGDNSIERIICATSLTDNDRDNIAEGNSKGIKGYSIIFMQKIVDNKTIEIPIYENYFSENSIAECDVEAIADFNGDGILDILTVNYDIGFVYIEGLAYPTYELKEFNDGNFKTRFEYTKYNF